MVSAHLVVVKVILVDYVCRYMFNISDQVSRISLTLITEIDADYVGIHLAGCRDEHVK